MVNKLEMMKEDEIIEFLYGLNSGNPILRDCIERLEINCDFTFLRKLKKFLIFGNEKFNFGVHPKVSKELNEEINFIGNSMNEMNSNVELKKSLESFKIENFDSFELKIKEMKKLITTELWKHSSSFISKLKEISNFYFILGEQDTLEEIEFNFPLNVIISNLNLEIYQRIHYFLREMKFISRILKETFIHQKEIEISIFRNEISFVISNLELFFFNDVIIPKVEEFQKKLNQNLNFDSLEEIHFEFLKYLTNEMFLNFSSIQNCFKEIFNISIEFCKRLDVKLFETFKKYCKLLFHFLSSIRNSLTQKLVFRLNYNNYFIKDS
jgi:hypothetical protein